MGDTGSKDPTTRVPPTPTGFWSVLVGALGMGALGVVALEVSGRFRVGNEEWDSPAWPVSVLALFAASFVAGYCFRDRPLLWGATPWLGQWLFMFVKNGPGNLWPLSLILFGGLAAIGTGLAFAGTRLRSA